MVFKIYLEGIYKENLEKIWEITGTNLGNIWNETTKLDQTINFIELEHINQMRSGSLLN